MILVIDNYDSFTHNLMQYLGEIGGRFGCAAERPGISYPSIRSALVPQLRFLWKNIWPFRGYGANSAALQLIFGT